MNPETSSHPIRRGDFLRLAALTPLAAATASSYAQPPIQRSAGPLLKPALYAYSFLELLTENMKDTSKGIDLFRITMKPTPARCRTAKDLPAPGRKRKPTAQPIQPDSHVFRGNLWGSGGRATKSQEAGGYTMPVEWATATRAEPLRLVFSQTIFCKGHTHTGPTLNKNHFDWDSNGWPRSGRQRALQPLKGNRTLMVHGDQHLGLLVRQGIDAWNDGPWAFMVPGTANGWPRAWWPEDGRITGDFTDPFGNKFSVLAAANPEKGSNTLKPQVSDPPETVAQLKGSGHGMMTIAPDRKSAVFEMWRYQFDAKNPKPGDQFDGFPQTIRFGE